MCRITWCYKLLKQTFSNDDRMHFNRHIWTYIITYKLLRLTVLYINIQRIKMHDKLILKTEKLKTFIFSQMSSWVSWADENAAHTILFQSSSSGKWWQGWRSSVSHSWSWKTNTHKYELIKSIIDIKTLKYCIKMNEAKKCIEDGLHIKRWRIPLNNSCYNSEQNAAVLTFAANFAGVRLGEGDVWLWWR